MASTDDNRKIITLSQLKNVVEQIKSLFMRISSDGILKTLKIKKDDNSSGVTLSEDDNHNLRVTRVENGNTVNAGIYTTALRNGNKWTTFPGVTVTNVQDLESNNYLGELVTTRSQGFEVRRHLTESWELEDAPQEIPLYAGAYNIIVGQSFRIQNYLGPVLMSSKQPLTFVQLTIDSGTTGVVDIEWDSNLKWPAGQPEWNSYDGYTFVVMIIRGICTILAKYRTAGQGGSGSGEIVPNAESNILGRGSLNTAKNYLNDLKNNLFEWILEDTDGTNVVIKPIWHIGGGTFIDALGYVLEGDTSN